MKRHFSMLAVPLLVLILLIGIPVGTGPAVSGEAAVPALEADPALLIRTAIDNLHNAYAPYSGFTVSAAVLMDSGKIYTGVNIENASYPATVCAERNAIFQAVSCGERRIIAIAIVGGPEYEIRDYCPPCGVCRQVMREFCVPEEMTVYFAKSPTDYRAMTLSELLPESFGPEALEK